VGSRSTRYGASREGADTESVSGLTAIGGPDLAFPSGPPFRLRAGATQFFLCSRRSPMVAGMAEAPEKLVPARRGDLIATLAFALTRDSRLAKAQAAELTASIVAERIIDRLEASGYIVMRGPPAPGAGPIGSGPKGR
jgi:hypothetical protein